MFCNVTLLAVGGYMFYQWRNARNAGQSREARFWMLLSALPIAFGLVGVMGAMLRVIHGEKWDALAHNNQGLEYLEQAKWDLAIEEFDQAISFEPELAAAYANRGFSYNQVGNYDRAIADCGQAIALDPELAMAFTCRGMSFFRQGDLESAMADFDQAITLNPKASETYFGRGVIYAARGELETAIVEFDQAISFGPQIANFYFMRGGTYAQLGKQSELAVADLERAIELGLAPEQESIAEELLEGLR